MKDGLESDHAGHDSYGLRIKEVVYTPGEDYLFDPQSVSAVWGDLRAEHFDGHTEFTRMSQEQRLAWLSELAIFIYSAREWRAARDRDGDLAA